MTGEDLPAAPPGEPAADSTRAESIPAVEWTPVEVEWTPAQPAAAPPSPPPSPLPAWPAPQYPPFPAYPMPSQAASRRRWRLWVAVGLAAVLLLCGGAVAVLVNRGIGSLDPGAAVAASPGVSSDRPRSPLAGAAPADRVPWLRDQITTVLAAQAAALLRGDRAGFLATADPKATSLISDLRRRFDALRQLKVAKFAERLASHPAQVSGSTREWTADVYVDTCFGSASCVTDSVLVSTRWVATSAGLRMAKLGTSDDDDNGPRPWEVSALRAAVGKRVIVATTARYAGRLNSLLREAEKAAALADRFANGRTRPDWYRVYAAAPGDWKRWYGGTAPAWSAGFATQIGDEHMDIALNMAEIPTSYLGETLRHEMAHVVTLAGASYTHSGNFWLIEGIAEYIMESGRPVSGYSGRLVTRRYVRSGKWNGHCDIGEPSAKTADWQVGAAYGISYYAVRRLADTYGAAAMRGFFDEVVVNDKSLDTAAAAVLKTTWAKLDADCGRFVRKSVG